MRDKVHFCEVESLGEVVMDTFKCATHHIKIVRYIPIKEWRKRFSKNYNTGYSNSGDGYINYFCTEKKYFLFDIEVEKIPHKIKFLDMSWFNLKDKTYKEAWSQCPDEILNIIKSISEFKKEVNKKKFYKITGIKI